MEIRTTSEKQTQKVAENFAKKLKAGNTIALYGDLGAGKTQFFKGLARGLGIRIRVTSPTFVFVKTYKVKSKIINHIDLYRSEQISDLKELGLEEIIGDNSITVIEWADRLGGNLPQKRVDIFIETIDEKTRKIRIVRH